MYICRMKLDVMAIGAHPDDVELSCGGTVAKLVRQGRIVGLVDLTNGELGTRGTPELRAAEAAEAGRILGIHARESLGIPDGNIEMTQENILKLVQVIREFKPDVLLIPHSPDRHPDHEHAHSLCKKAWFAAGLRRVETMYQGKPQFPHRPRAYYHFMQWFEFPPSFIVDVTETYDQRMDAMRAFRSQFFDPDSTEPQTILSTPEFIEMINTRLSYYGDKIERKYGEAFFSPSAIMINDPVSLNT
jgi:N-acetylglucosamine malate deacetylase 1